MPARHLAIAALLISLALPGCDVILSHPSIPPKAADVARRSVDAVLDLRKDVASLLAGFPMNRQEQAAVAQYTDAMFTILGARDASELVRAGVAFKRAQACLLSVGLESSGVIDSIHSAILDSPERAQFFRQFGAWIENADIPPLGEMVCDKPVYSGY